MDGDKKLLDLRYDPRGVLATISGFVVSASDAYSTKATGGRCRVACRSLKSGFYELTPAGNGGEDYFYPFVSFGLDTGDGLKGVGRCRVPAGVPAGTIVLTGAMNGCALEVRKDGDTLVFYHDANSKAMAKQESNPSLSGRRCCRIDADQYYDDDIGHAGLMAFKAQQAGATPKHFLISVKTDEEWVVLHSPAFEVKSDYRPRTGWANIRWERYPQIKPPFVF